MDPWLEADSLRKIIELHRSFINGELDFSPQSDDPAGCSEETSKLLSSLLDYGFLPTAWQMMQETSCSPDGAHKWIYEPFIRAIFWLNTYDSTKRLHSLALALARHSEIYSMAYIPVERNQTESQILEDTERTSELCETHQNSWIYSSIYSSLSCETAMFCTRWCKEKGVWSKRPPHLDDRPTVETYLWGYPEWFWKGKIAHFIIWPRKSKAHDFPRVLIDVTNEYNFSEVMGETHNLHS